MTTHPKRSFRIGRWLSLLATAALAGCSSVELPRQEEPFVIPALKLKEAEAIRAQTELHRRQQAEIDVALMEVEDQETRTRAIELHRSILERSGEFDREIQEGAGFFLPKLLMIEAYEGYRLDMDAYEKVMETFDEGEILEIPNTPAYDFSASTAYYKSFIASFPDSPNVEDALYDLGTMAQNTGTREEAIAYYRELLERFPTSRYAAECYFRMGEYYFDREILSEALNHYQTTVALGDNAFYDKALFKIGWCHYNEENYDRALQTFDLLVAKPPEEMDARGSSDLYHESIEILVKVFNEIGGAPETVAFIETKEDDRLGPTLLHQLGDLYKTQSQFQESVEAYQELLDRYPLYREAPFVMKSLISNYNVERASAEAERLQEGYLDAFGAESDWGIANEDQGLRIAVDTIIRESLKGVILRNHKKGRDDADASGYEKALHYYPRYLVYFPGDEESYRTRFHYAQALFETNHFKEAAAEFEALSKDAEFSEFREETAYHRILSVELDKEKGESFDDDLISACLDYIDLVPESDKNALMLFKIGEIEFNRENLDLAIERFKMIREEHPASEYAPRATSLIIEAYFKDEQFDQVERWCRNILAEEGPIDAGKKNRLEELLVLSTYKQAETGMSEEAFLTAAGKFVAFADEFPDNALASEALYNAGLAFHKASAEDEAATIYQRIIDDTPESEFFTDAILLVNPIYQDRKKYDMIRKNIDILYRQRPDDAHGKDALFSLAKILHNESAYETSKALFKQYRSRYPDDHARNLEGRYKITKMAIDSGGADQAVDLYKDLIEAHRAALEKNPELEFNPYYLAEARFEIAESVNSEYSTIRLVEPLAENLRAKEEYLSEVIQEYLKVIELGYRDFITNASYKIGHAYEEFRDALVHSQVPGDLDGEYLEAYLEQLEEQAYPYEEKAAETYKAAMTRAEELGIFDKWVGLAGMRLSVLEPWNYELLESEIFMTVIQPVEPVEAEILRGHAPEAEVLLDADLQPADIEPIEIIVPPPPELLLPPFSLIPIAGESE